jgi:hypothetical protein
VIATRAMLIFAVGAAAAAVMNPLPMRGVSRAWEKA